MFWSFSNILCSFWTFDVLFGLSTFWFLTFWPFPELLASITSTFNFYEPYLTSEWPHDDDCHSRWQPQDQACGRGHPRLPQALPIPLHITQGRIQGIWKFDFISLNCNSYFNHVTIHKICYNSTHFSQSPYSDKRMYLAYFTIWLRNGPIT